jgi:hypothetical protein
VGSITDIKPEKIAVAETYRYEAVVRRNDSIKAIPPPRGQVVIHLPYDGENYFPVQAAEELAQKQELDTLKIGAVALGDPKDWKGNWDQKLGVDLLDVEIPLRTNEVTEEQWAADELLIQCTEEYSPDPPEYFPIQINVRVLDTHAIHPVWLNQDNFQKDIFWEMLSEASSKILRSNTLSLEIEVKASAPSILGGKDLKVCLEQLLFSWPKVPSRSQFQILQMSSNYQKVSYVAWDYEPARRKIILENIEMNYVPGKLGNPLSAYRAVIRINLEFGVGDLLKADQFAGSAVVRVDDCLLSGRDVAWIGWNGRRNHSSTKITKKTLVEVDFVASLFEQFAVRRSFISRRWIFPGVTLQPARLNDIISVLMDLGYIDVRPVNGNGRIFGNRRIVSSGEGQTELWVWIQLQEELSTTTTRERKMEDTETYRTEIPTHVLAINFFGQMNGSGEVLAQDAENLMSRLKDQFTAIADLR